VYLAQDESSGRQFALKKIRCPTGAEGVREAMREVEAYRRFRHPNIIRIFDSAVVQDKDGEGKVVYLFLPLYSRGNLQDAINTHSINNTHFGESEILRLFKGTCEAVRAMHDYRAPVKSGAANGNATTQQMKPSRHSVDDDDADHMFPQPEGDEEGGFSYHAGGSSGPSVPLVTRRKVQEGDVVFNGDEELAERQPDPSAPTGETEHVPYAHRDLKPGWVTRF